MEHRSEVHAAEKREIGSDASMRSVRRRDLPKEHVPAENFSEFRAERGNLKEYVTCTYTVAVFQPFIV